MSGVTDLSASIAVLNDKIESLLRENENLRSTIRDYRAKSAASFNSLTKEEAAWLIEELKRLREAEPMPFKWIAFDRAIEALRGVV